MTRLVKLLSVVALLVSPAHAQVAPPDCPPSPDGKPYFVVCLPQDQRVRFRNPDGSCVQCSISMCGVACDIPAAENLLWDTKYGARVRGGSDPSRVPAYCNARGIAAWNIYSSEAFEWVKWSLRNGRPCGITWGAVHMITAVGYSGATLDANSMIAVCDNNSPQRIDWYTQRQFLGKFQGYGSCGWVVILRTPPPAGRADYMEWWAQ